MNEPTNERIQIGVILNPNALKSQKERDRSGRLKSYLGESGVVITTRDINAIDRALRSLDQLGIRTIIVDGGDGAMHWALNKAVHMFGLDAVLNEFRFVPSAGGTIDFIAHALEFPKRTKDIVRGVRDELHRASPRVTSIKSMVIDLTYTNGDTEKRYAFGSPIAGYAANFYGPFYRGRTLRGPARIVGLLGAGFGTAAIAQLFRGPASSLKPKAIKKAEYDYLRPLTGEVYLNGSLVPGGGESGREYNLVQCGSVRINLANVLKVFHAANDEGFHAQVGYLRTHELFPEVVRAAIGREIKHEDVHDGHTSRLDVIADPGHEMIPCLDGELFDDVQKVTVTPGPAFRFLQPHF